MSLANVCLVIDMDGFCVDKKFYPRELGYHSFGDGYTGSYRFRLNRFARLLTPGDWKTAHYCTRRVHGMTFASPPWEKELFDVEHLDQLVINLYRENKRRDRFLVAYKGGRVEKDLLDRLEIPSVNLESFGCPKYDDLPETRVEKDCGHHRGLLDAEKGPLHCPKIECLAFAEWIKNTLSNEI